MSTDVLQPPQQQDRQPGIEREMVPRPEFAPKYPGVGKLKGKVALITGGDSGIGRAVAVAMAREGARIAIAYLDEHKDANATRDLVRAEGTDGLLIPGDAGEEAYCEAAVEAVIAQFGRLDILVNNAAEQHETFDIRDIEAEQIERTFRTNVYSYFFMTKHALRRMEKGGTIINTASVVAYQGHKTLLDYSATKGAIVAFTRSLSQALVKEGIRVNAVAPGPIWTPLIPASFEPAHVAKHGAGTPMERAGQPNEVAPCYVFLASEDASYISGQVLHPNGGDMVES